MSREGERRRRIRPLFSSSSSLSLSHFTPISSSSFQSQKKAISLSASQSVGERVRWSKKSVSNHKFLKCRSLSAAQEMDLFVLDTIWAVNWLFSLPPIPPQTTTDSRSCSNRVAQQASPNLRDPTSWLSSRNPGEASLRNSAFL